MAATILGVDNLNHLTGTVSWTGAATGVAYNPQSVNFQQTADESEVKDGDGDVISVNLTNQQNTLEIELIPTHATDVSSLVLPDKGVVITLASFKWSALNGDYNMVSGSISGSNDGSAARISLSLKQYAGDDKLDIQT
jgi:hypothetical protein